MSSPTLAPEGASDILPVEADPSAAGATTRAPRRARGQLRVDALLASAAEVFATKGFDAATMTEIAAQADSSIGSLYQFFRTKDAVAEALVRQQVEALWERFDRVAERAATLAVPELARALGRLLADFRADHPSFERLIETPSGPSPLVAGVRGRVRARIADILRRNAPALDEATIEAMAPVVQQTMKAAIQIRAELAGAERAASQRELEAMLGGYLAARLAGRPIAGDPAALPAADAG